MTFRKLLASGLAAFMMVSTGIASAEVEELPPSVFKLVQSSPRTEYYFNKEQIKFAKTSQGTPNLQCLVVPVLKKYDKIMIKDVVSKRRWNKKSLEGFEDLAGAAEYIAIDMEAKTVTIKQQDMMDSTWTVIESAALNQVVDMTKLSQNSWDSKLYNAIIDYAMRNKLKLADRTYGKLTRQEREELLQDQEAYRSQHKAVNPEDNEGLY